MAVQEADDSDPEDEDEYERLADGSNMSWTEKAPTSGVARVKRNVEWIGDPIKSERMKTFYTYVFIKLIHFQYLSRTLHKC